MVQPDKRLLWHPRHDNKFVVGGGSQITLYEWAEEYPEIRHVTSQQDLQFMKASSNLLPRVERVYISFFCLLILLNGSALLGPQILHLTT